MMDVNSINFSDSYSKYFSMIIDAFTRTDRQSVFHAAQILEHAAESGSTVLVCGNGGSAAIAEHFSCDHMKGVRQSEQNRLRPVVQSLGSNVSLLTALANDFSYEDVFAKQIEYCEQKYAVVVVVSSSGNSPNVVKALQTAYNKGYATIALVGFDGGKILKDKVSDITIHVPSDNYGVVEDCHQMIMHMMAQWIRDKTTPFNFTESMGP